MTPSLPAAVRKRNLWLSAFVALTGLSLVTLFMFVNRFAYLSQKPYLLLAVAVAAVIGAYLSWDPTRAAFTTVKSLKSGGEPSEAGGVPPQMLGDPRLAQLANGNPQVMRLLLVVASVSDKLLPVMDGIKVNSDGELTDYKFHSTSVGLLGQKGLQNQLYDALRANIAGEGWDIRFHPKTDELVATRGNEIPKLALPSMWPVTQTKEAAKTAYNKWELVLGECVNGPVTINPQVFPHLVAVATSGGGKSVFLRTCAEQFRAIGAQLIFGDGKGSDYAAYNGLPNVIAMGRGSGARGMEYAAAIEMAYRIMQDRQDKAADRKLKDPDGWKNQPPVFVILDEMKAVMKKWKSDLKTDEFKQIESRMNQVLALGRELRVHVCFAVQDVYAESIPRPWLTNVGMKVSLGKPNNMTINQAFSGDIETDARRVADRINPKIRGRGMIAGVDEDSGIAQVVEYQGFLSYAPGESIANAPTPEAQQNMSLFKSQVTDAIPRLYSRRWFRIEEKSEAQVKLENKQGDLGYIDFEMFTTSELAALQIVNLDMRDENGNIVPNPEMVPFDPDPNNPHYVCRRVLTESNSIEDI